MKRYALNNIYSIKIIFNEIKILQFSINFLNSSNSNFCYYEVRQFLIMLLRVVYVEFAGGWLRVVDSSFKLPIYVDECGCSFSFYKLHR